MVRILTIGMCLTTRLRTETVGSLPKIGWLGQVGTVSNDSKSMDAIRMKSQQFD